jgi:hypothetical protein
MIDRTYGHLTAGADQYERELLDGSTTGAPNRMALFGRRGHGRCCVARRLLNDRNRAVVGLRRERERRGSNPPLNTASRSVGIVHETGRELEALGAETWHLGDATHRQLRYGCSLTAGTPAQ